jgi:hypothetical protein
MRVRRVGRERRREWEEESAKRAGREWEEEEELVDGWLAAVTVTKIRAVVIC